MQHASEGLGESPQINDTYTKLYPCCRYTHFAIEACFALRQQIEDISDIESIEVNTFDIAYEATAPNPKPQNSAQARFSMHYLVAVALIEGFVGLKDFTAESISRSEMSVLGDQVTCHSTKEWNDLYPQTRGAEVRIALKGGAVLSHKTSQLAGMPGDYEAAPKKFRNTCATFYSAEEMECLERLVKGLPSAEQTIDVLSLVKMPR